MMHQLCGNYYRISVSMCIDSLTNRILNWSNTLSLWNSHLWWCWRAPQSSCWHRSCRRTDACGISTASWQSWQAGHLVHWEHWEPVESTSLHLLRLRTPYPASRVPAPTTAHTETRTFTASLWWKGKLKSVKGVQMVSPPGTPAGRSAHTRPGSAAPSAARWACGGWRWRPQSWPTPAAAALIYGHMETNN